MTSPGTTCTVQGARPTTSLSSPMTSANPTNPTLHPSEQTHWKIYDNQFQNIDEKNEIEVNLDYKKRYENGAFLYRITEFRNLHKYIGIKEFNSSWEFFTPNNDDLRGRIVRNKRDGIKTYFQILKKFKTIEEAKIHLDDMKKKYDWNRGFTFIE